jgi:zinc finger SWIM domain-containing protein 3
MDGDDPYIEFSDFLDLDVVLEDDEAEKEGENQREMEEDGDNIVEQIRPYTGMEFQTSDEAFNFYNSYAGQVGFSARKDTCAKSKNGVSSMRFCCSKEGFSKRQIVRQQSMGITTDHKTPERENGSTRTGCKAYLTIKVLKMGIWQVSVFNEEHNHPLILSPSKN